MLRLTLALLVAAAAAGCAVPQLDLSPPRDHPASAEAPTGRPPLSTRVLAEPAPEPEPETDHTGHHHHDHHGERHP